MWSDGPLATLVLDTRLPPGMPVALTVRAHALSQRKAPTRTVTVLVGGMVVGTWEIGPEETSFSATLQPSHRTADATVVQFQIEETTSPYDLGLSEDPRRLSVGLHSVRVSRGR